MPNDFVVLVPGTSLPASSVMFLFLLLFECQIMSGYITTLKKDLHERRNNVIIRVSVAVFVLLFDL